MLYNKKDSGFSLVELSIVITIMGLIVAGITVAIELVNVSRLKVVIAEFREHDIAISRFKGKFYYSPGDFPDATKYWAGSGNGDGNFVTDNQDGCVGSIANPGEKEDLKVWRHLQLSGMTNKSYQGDCVSGRFLLGQTIPSSASIVDGGYWYFTTGLPSGDNFYGRPSDFAIQFAALTSSGTELSASVLEPRNAMLIDSKIDDGVADTGAVFTSNGDGITKASSNSCVDGDPGDALASYELDNDEISCIMLYFPAYK